MNVKIIYKEAKRIFLTSRATTSVKTTRLVVLALFALLFYLCYFGGIFSANTPPTQSNENEHKLRKQRTVGFFYAYDAHRHAKRYASGKYEIDTPVILTYASRSFYDRLVNLLGSFHIWAPEIPIVVVDMGLNATQRKNLLEMKGVSFWNFNFRNYPNHVQDLHTFAWKPIIVAELLMQHTAVLVQDSGQEMRAPPTRLLELLSTDGYFFVKQKSTFSKRPKKNQVMARYISEFKTQDKFDGFNNFIDLPHIAGGINGWVRDSVAYHKVLLPSLECALVEECASVVEDQQYMTALVHFAGLNYQEAGKYWADWRLPWHLTSDPLQHNDVLMYSRKFGCPKPYAQHVDKKMMKVASNQIQIVMPLKERALKKGEGCNFQYDHEYWNRYTMDQMKNYYKGERVFLIGNAPSLNRLPMHLLNDEFTLSFNNFHMFHDRISWKPTMYMCIDSLVCPDIADDINRRTNLYRHSFIPWMYADTKVQVDYTQSIKDNRRIQWLEFARRENEELAFESRETAFKVKTRGTVASVGLEVLSHLGFAEIIVIGVDMEYEPHTNVQHFGMLREEIQGMQDDDTNHFDPRYFGKGKKFHEPRAKEYMLPSFLNALKIVETNAMQTANCHVYEWKESCRNHDNCRWLEHKCVQHAAGIRVYNAGWGGALPEDKIARKSFRSFFPATSLMDEVKIFGEGLSQDFDLNIHLKPNDHDLASIFVHERGVVSISSVEEFDARHDIVIAPEALITALIPVSITTHITRGPINGQAVLISRSYYRNERYLAA